MYEYELLLTDECDVYSYTEQNKGYITKPVEQLVSEKVQCKYRKNSLNQIENGVPVINATHTLITKDDFIGNEGDKVVVDSQGEKIVLRLGERFVFKAIPHYEFNCIREGVV